MAARRGRRGEVHEGAPGEALLFERGGAIGRFHLATIALWSTDGWGRNDASPVAKGAAACFRKGFTLAEQR